MDCLVDIALVVIALVGLIGYGILEAHEKKERHGNSSTGPRGRQANL